MYVHFREIFGSLQFVDEGGDEGEWVSVLDCVFIEISIILTRPQSTVLLLNKEEGRGLGGPGLPNLAGFEVFINEFFACFGLFRIYGVGFGYLWGEGFF